MLRQERKWRYKMLKTIKTNRKKNGKQKQEQRHKYKTITNMVDINPTILSIF